MITSTPLAHLPHVLTQTKPTSPTPERKFFLAGKIYKLFKLVKLGIEWLQRAKKLLHCYEIVLVFTNQTVKCSHLEAIKFL